MNNTHSINAKIKELEEQKAKLLLLRKEEIFNVLEKSGGLALDNRLLAGLAVYALEKDSNSNTFLKELYDLGERKIPSKKRSVAKAKSSGTALEENSGSNAISANAT